jgi:hypothetical protein
MLTPFSEEHRLTVTGILATKLHAIVDRGFRRDFFDLYVMLQDQSLGMADCLAAMRAVHTQPIPDEGKKDWETVKDYFLTRIGHLLIPPARKLSIQSQRIDVKPG